jgi:hypothetical protein
MSNQLMPKYSLESFPEICKFKLFWTYNAQLRSHQKKFDIRTDR